MSQFTKIIEFSGEGVYIRFLPVCNVPGYSHRVVILDQDKNFIVSGWLKEGVTITHKCAEYYFQKYELQIARGAQIF